MLKTKTLYFYKDLKDDSNDYLIDLRNHYFSVHHIINNRKYKCSKVLDNEFIPEIECKLCEYHVPQKEWYFFNIIINQENKILLLNKREYSKLSKDIHFINNTGKANYDLMYSLLKQNLVYDFMKTYVKSYEKGKKELLKALS